MCHVAPLAQWLEQRPFKSWVVGSSPTGGTFSAGLLLAAQRWAGTISTSTVQSSSRGLIPTRMALGGFIAKSYSTSDTAGQLDNRQHDIGEKRCYNLATGNRVVVAVYASIGNINDVLFMEEDLLGRCS